jgi:hypothetical protein
MLHAYSAYSGVTLVASYTQGGGGGTAGKLPVVVESVGAKSHIQDRLIDELADNSQKLATSWNNNGSNATAWFTLDLGGSYDVSELLIAPRANRNYTLSIHIGDTLSSGKVTAAAVGTCTPEQEGVSIPTYLKSCPITETSGRYVTIQLNGGGWFKVYGVEIWGGSDGGSPPNAPTVPENLSGSATGTTEISLTWDASSDLGGGSVAGYSVYRDGVGIATTTVTSYNDTGLTPATSYAYTVSAYDDATPANESDQSSPPVNVVTFTQGGGGGTAGKLPVVVESVGAKSHIQDRLIDELADNSQKLATSWNNNGSNATAWFTLDLGGSYDVSELLIAPRANRNYTLSIHIGDTLSSGKVTAAAVGTCTPEQEGVSIPTYLKSCPITETSGRYVTIQLNGGGWFKVYGVEIWGG